MTLVSLLILILIAVLVVVILFWIIDATGVPAPANWIAKLIIALIIVLFILQRSGFSLGSLG